MRTSVTLRKMRFFAYHGVAEQERTVGNHFEVSMKLYAPMLDAMEHDTLDGTVDYSAVYQIVEKEMQKPSLLLENVAWRIVNAVRAAFPQVTGGEVTVSKLTPPFKCDLQSVEIAVEF